MCNCKVSNFCTGDGLYKAFMFYFIEWYWSKYHDIKTCLTTYHVSHYTSFLILFFSLICKAIIMLITLRFGVDFWFKTFSLIFLIIFEYHNYRITFSWIMACSFTEVIIIWYLLWMICLSLFTMYFMWHLRRGILLEIWICDTKCLLLLYNNIKK